MMDGTLSMCETLQEFSGQCIADQFSGLPHNRRVDGSPSSYI